jgi:hypothetical protein
MGLPLFLLLVLLVFFLLGTALVLVYSKWRASVLAKRRRNFVREYQDTTHMPHYDGVGPGLSRRLLLLVSVYSGPGVILECMKEVLASFTGAGVTVDVLVCKDEYHASRLDFDHKKFDALCVGETRTSFLSSCLIPHTNLFFSWR